jgi:hypothetical protein
VSVPLLFSFLPHPIVYDASCPPAPRLRITTASDPSQQSSFLAKPWASLYLLWLFPPTRRVSLSLSLSLSFLSFSLRAHLFAFSDLETVRLLVLIMAWKEAHLVLYFDAHAWDRSRGLVGRSRAVSTYARAANPARVR